MGKIKNGMRIAWDWLCDMSLRIILLAGMIIVFSSGVYLSWQHTLHMAIRHGFAPDEALIYTVLVETLLAVAELVVIFRATMGKTIPLAVYVGVATAVTINLVGNVSSFWEVSSWGVALGASITLITAVAIWIFATTLTDTHTATDTQGATADTTTDRQETSKTTDSVLDALGVVGQAISKTQTTRQTQTVADKTTATIETNSTTTARQTVDTDNEQTTDGKTDTKTTDSKQDKTDNDTTSDTKIDTQTATTKTARQTRKTRQTKLSVIKGSKTSDSDKRARQQALDYYNKTGNFPSYRQLGELANISKDKAGKIIKELKAKTS